MFTQIRKYNCLKHHYIHTVRAFCTCAIDQSGAIHHNAQRVQHQAEGFKLRVWNLLPFKNESKWLQMLGWTQQLAIVWAFGLSWKENARWYLKKENLYSEAVLSICQGQTCSYYAQPALPSNLSSVHQPVWHCVDRGIYCRCEIACSAHSRHATSYLTSNNSVSAPQRNSPDVKAANKEWQTIIPTVSLVSCCCTEIVVCMCKQSTLEKLHNKQFKAVVRMLRHDAHRPTAGWTAICWVVMVSGCQV